MAANITQERDVVQREQPVGIVEQQCRRIVAPSVSFEIEVALKLRQDALQIGANLPFGNDGPRRGLAGRVANQRGAAAAKRDRPVAEPL
jgi:hypothetical protein